MIVDVIIFVLANNTNLMPDLLLWYGLGSTVGQAGGWAHRPRMSTFANGAFYWN